MKPSKKKIEVWVSDTSHDELRSLCQQTGYTMAETVRRAIDSKIEELKKRVKS